MCHCYYRRYFITCAFVNTWNSLLFESVCAPFDYFKIRFDKYKKKTRHHLSLECSTYWYRKLSIFVVQ